MTYLLTTTVESDCGRFDYVENETYKTLNEFLDNAASAISKGDFMAAYQITNEFYCHDINLLLADRSKRKVAAIAAAEAKLTSEELELLGIK